MERVECENERAEYSWSIATDGAYSASNPSQALRSSIGLGGLEILPSETSKPAAGAPWGVGLRTRSFGGSERDVSPLGEPRLARHENRVELHYAALCEWYVNDERGIEQGWTIPAPPPGEAGSALRIEIEIQGLRPQIAGDGRSAVLVDEAKQTRLRYGGLRAWDAAGRELAARLLVVPAGLAIEVEVGNALYPITIDPVLSGPVWTAESDEAHSYFGSVSGAGDVNGDGFEDVIVGAFNFDGDELAEGGAFLYFGSASGPSLAPDWTAEGDQAWVHFGGSVSGAGDVNGDGFDDVVVGATYYTNGEQDEGRAFLYLGSASGPSLAPDWTAESNQEWAYFGSVSGAGDVNGDGFDDVIVGAPLFDHAPPNEGRAFLYLGSASGPSLAPDWTAESNQPLAFFGASISGAGDVNGDGFDDVIIGAPDFDNGQEDEGRAFLYLGSASGPSLTPDWTAEGDQSDARFGIVCAAGDVNGDGFDDVVVGAYRAENGQHHEGRAFLYLGSASGLSLAPAWTAESDQQGAYFGGSVSGAGDVNGDGFDDVIVGAEYFHHGEEYEGRAFLYLGSASGLSLAPAWTAESDQPSAFFAASVSAAGDVNGDGLDDVIVGAPYFDNDQPNEGRAFVYVGSASVGINYCIANANSSGAPAEISAWHSASVAAGDLELNAHPVSNQSGLFFHGSNPTQTVFGNGYLCTSGGIVRGAVIQGAGHFATYTYDNSDAQHSMTAWVGSTRHFQYWFRDPMAGGALFNTSNAISIAVRP